MTFDLNSKRIILLLCFSTLDFTESYMVDYCLKRPSHQVDGKVLTVTRAEPEFEEENFGGDDEENGNEETEEAEEDCDNVAKAMDDVD